MPHKKIRAEIKRNAPKAFHSSKRKFGFKYPKLFLLTLSIILAYFLFTDSSSYSWVSELANLNSYLGAFVSGIFLAFGFTSAFGVGLLFALQPLNIFLAAFIGGVGATISNLIIFKTIKVSFREEFNELKKTEVIKKIELVVRNHRHVLLKHYILYAIAGIMIATPLPDEIGVSMLAGLTTIKPYMMALISFVLHTSTIFLILWVV